MSFRVAVLMRRRARLALEHIAFNLVTGAVALLPAVLWLVERIADQLELEHRPAAASRSSTQRSTRSAWRLCCRSPVGSCGSLAPVGSGWHNE
jgi:hypothetical protein